MKIPQRYGFGTRHIHDDDVSARDLIRSIIVAAEHEGLREVPYIDGLEEDDLANHIINQFILELQGTGEV